MSKQLSPTAERRVQRFIDIGERAACLLLYSILVIGMWNSLEARPYNILALFSESLVVFFVLIRRDATVITTRPQDWIIALAATALPLLIRAGGEPLAPTIIGSILMLIGLTISVWAKLILRRGFGLAAANRGVVNAGPYRFVRHPMYTGYVIVYLGFVLNNPLPRNFALYAVAICLLILRVLAEERILALDSAYSSFMSRVRYRLAPGLF